MLKKKSLFIVGLLLSTGGCLAESEMQGRMEEKMEPWSAKSTSAYIYNMGLTGGGENPNGVFRTKTQLGVVANSQQIEGAGFGAEVNTTQLDDADKTRRTLALAQAAYRMGGDIPLIKDTYVAVGAGPAFVKSKVRWAVAPAVGFDVPLNNKIHETISLGLNARYVGVNSSPDSYVGSAAVKYWY